MTKKIDGQGFGPTDAAGARRTERSTAARPNADTGAKRAAEETETVNLTRFGLSLARLEEALQRVPVVDAARVQTIRDALATGRYEIDDRAIAARLLQADRELPA
jgi:negative regulator of flagellin synthesis FlgM